MLQHVVAWLSSGILEKKPKCCRHVFDRLHGSSKIPIEIGAWIDTTNTWLTRHFYFNQSGTVELLTGQRLVSQTTVKFGITG